MATNYPTIMVNLTSIGDLIRYSRPAEEPE
jgi:hypothetical protein